MTKRDKLTYEMTLLRNELSEMRTQHQEFYDLSPCSYFTLDHDCIIRSVNLAGAALLGFDRSLLNNKPFLNFVNIHCQLIFKKYIGNVFINQNSGSCQVELIKKGSNRWIANIESLCLKNNLVLISASDITYIKKLELENFQFQKNFFLLENLFQHANDAVAVLNLEYYFIMLNNAFVYSFTKIFAFKIELHMNFLIILADFPDLKNKIISACNKAMLGQKTSLVIENPTENEDAYYCYEIYFNPIFELQCSKKHGIAMLIKDITEYNLNQRRLAKQQATLAHATRMNAIGEMASALAHEINQPLAAINIYSHTCLEQFKSLIKKNNKLLTALNKIHLLSQTAGEILHRMKNFIREGVICAEKTNLNILIREALTFLDPHVWEVKFQIELTLDHNLPLVTVDKIKIMQVILNLSQNSIEALHDHTEKNLTIFIKTTLNNDFVEIDFRDNGPGIPQELMSKISGSYFTTKSRGTGLGLGICRTIIEAHGGKLFIKESLEKGAWINFTLPVNEP